MPDLTEDAFKAASIAVERVLRGRLGWGMDAATTDEVVDAVLEAFGDEGLVVVRADDLDAYLNRTGLGENVLREVGALNRLLAAIEPEDSKEATHAHPA